jgi:DNA-binding NarL/FixJ family response regulator
MNKPEQTTARLRVLIVEDHPLTRMGLVQVINHEPDLEVCAEAANATDALRAAAASRPDLVITDLSLPGRSGMDLIKDMKALHPKLPVLVVSMQDEMLYAERALRAGALGYVMKHEGGKKVIEAARNVLDGKIHVSAEVTGRILQRITGTPAKEAPGKASFEVERLSDRELDVFRLIGKGMDRNEIAHALNISIKTQDVHRANIRKRLGLKTPIELLRHATHWVESGTDAR